MSTASHQALIFGAGKIGRGFIAHLLDRAEYKLTFVDANPAAVTGLRQQGRYQLKVLGAPEKDQAIAGFDVLCTSDENAVAQAVAEHDLMACAVGAANLPAIGRLIAIGLEQRLAKYGNDAPPVNLIICENARKPAHTLRQAIYESASPQLRDWLPDHLGLVETQILRSCIEPTDELKAQDPFTVQVQDWWVLPCDADAFVGKPPAVERFSPRPNFENELLRKVYTYNCSNATISYLGFLRGYTMLSEAANDAEILAITQQVYDESGQALIAEFGFDEADQKALQDLAISKYKDKAILDPIERNGRDSRRKLSADDRLVGPALLVHKHGGSARALGIAIAAGYHYAGSDDPGTREVQRILRSQGLAAAIEQVSGLNSDHPLAQEILTSVPELERFNQANVDLVYA